MARVARALRGARGLCAHCGRGYALTKAGHVRAHLEPDGWDRCPGSGQLPR